MIIELMSDKKKLEKELVHLHEGSTYNIAKALFKLKRSFDNWALANLSKDGFPDMKISYIPFLFNITIDGITNNELATRIMISKQAMSKTLKELEKLQLVEFKPNPVDARSSLIVLTVHGMKMIIYIRKRVDKLSEKYIDSIGEKKYKEMIESLNSLIDLHKTM